MMIARCDATQVERIAALETELGNVVVAYEVPLAFADLSDEQLARLRAVEEELGLTLIVYRSGPGR